MNDSRHAIVGRHRLAGRLPIALLLLLLSALSAAAQSQDLGFPTAVSTNEIGGRIAARDIGDARLTRHYYILAGTPGDFVFTVTSNNLNGDVDIFTAGSLRPMGKISIYAGSQPTSATKTIFLRQRESLILRVEARSPNDNEGTYSVRFAGTFEPVMSAPTPPEESLTPTLSERTDRSVRRVTSSGARIDEPEPTPSSTETTASANTETTSPETTAATAQPSSTATEASAPAETAATKPEPVRTARTGRRPRGRRSSTRAATTRPQPSPGETSTESSSVSSSSSAPATLNPRLIIETRDGMRQERFMSTVRSVTVQNGQIVIVSSNGARTERISLASILKMSIEP
ncbi:MAG TPA: hypothetical protein VF544_02985 [Pyrinomonadaceae bacterium]|jgi:hypothetical protein